MKHLWQKLINMGIDETTDEHEMMYVQVCNGLSVLVSLWMLALVPLILPYWPDSIVFAINGVVFPLIWPLILLMNYKKKYMMARIYLTATSMAIITINVLTVGGQTENHLFIVMYIASALVTYPKLKQFSVVAAVGFAHFLFLEIWFRFHGPLTTADPSYYELIRLLSVLNIPILFIIIALYHKNLLLKTQKSLRERKQAFQNLLDHAGQGFLTFDRQLTVQEEYSKECVHLFGQGIAGARFAELLYPDDDSQQMLLEDILQTAFQDDDLQREVCISLMPAEADIREKRVKLQYKWINHPSASSTVMVVMTDISEQRNMEHRLEQEQNMMRMIVRVVKHDREFKELLADYQSFARDGGHLLFNHESSVLDKLSAMSLHVHTFKGNFSQFNLVHLPRRLHEIETQLENQKQWMQDSSSESLSPASLDAWLNQIDWMDLLADDMRILHDYLGDGFNNEDHHVMIEAERLQQLEQRVLERFPGPEGEWLVGEIHKLQYCPFDELLSMYPAYIEQIAKQTGKEVNPLILEGGDLLVDPNVYAHFSRALVHVFRNMVDHGIESPEERILLGKEARGQIACSVVGNDKEIILALSNDGKPIDLAAIRSIAQEKGMYTAEQVDAMTEEEQRMLIVQEGFSSKRTASLLSGRGVGLSAVYKALQELQGSMRIDSSAENGTTFTFVLPRNGTPIGA